MPTKPYANESDAHTTSLASSWAWLYGAGVGAASLILLTVIKYAFVESIGRPTPFLLYFGAVLIAAWYGGILAGLITTLISAGLGYVCFIVGSAEFSIPRALAQLAAFAFEGVVISWMTSRLIRDRRRSNAAVAAAEDATKQLEAALSGVDIGVTMLDARGEMVYANQAAAQIIGFASTAELLATDTEQILARFVLRDEHGNDLPLERLPGRALLEGPQAKEAKEVLIQFNTRDRAELRWSMLQANAIRDANGKARFIVNVFNDVTERQRQQEALRISHEWFSTTLRSIGDAVIATDSAARITFMNPVAEALTGWSAAECSNRPLAEVFRIVNETTRDLTESPVERVLREGVVVGLANHTILLRKDGSELAIDDSAAPIRDANEKVAGVVLVFRDVTESRRAAQRMEFLARASSELASSLDYATTLKTVADLLVPTIADWCAVDMIEHGTRRRLAVAHVDADLVEWVREVEQRYPPDPNATSGVPNILRTGQAEMMERIPSELLKAAAQDQEHLQIIERLQLRSYIGVPLKNGDDVFGVITLVMAQSGRTYVADDLTFALALAERASIAVINARLYRAAEAARRTAELADQAKDDFLALLGHELRNPLAPILTALELMKARDDQSAIREREIIERQVRTVIRLVDDLLEVSRITRGRVMLNLAPLEVGEIVTQGLELAGPLIAARHHQVNVDVPRGLTVVGDTIRLAQVMANLLNNAAKYSEERGTIQIKASRIGESIEMRIRDHGIGIEPTMLSRIFEVFVQEPRALDRAQGGLGLGLAIVKTLVQQHGGRVEARSEGIGRGSEFTVTLPATKAIAESDPLVLLPQSVADAAAIVLLVDDNLDALELMSAALECRGHRVHAVANGRDALAIVSQIKPDIALLDLGLPELDGYELARQVRAVPGLEALKMVAITGYGQASDREKTAAAGFAVHLVKPVEIETVHRIVEQSVRDRTNQRPTC